MYMVIFINQWRLTLDLHGNSYLYAKKIGNVGVIFFNFRSTTIGGIWSRATHALTVPRGPMYDGSNPDMDVYFWNADGLVDFTDFVLAATLEFCRPSDGSGLRF
ncbi:hypothetical protein L1987_24353 [Smallanthus sonchifolius]|uniref:Uncharacterized protein n=1 Tax=Smallanthus sonchifolius TaxID=185202 RepID=A0ACB9IJF6_9ASTR|nr:hypothetical protein L1987_24353 [Smallanthus sonchifolius]